MRAEKSYGFQGAVTRHPVNRHLPEMKYSEASGNGVNPISTVTADTAVIYPYPGQKRDDPFDKTQDRRHRIYILERSGIVSDSGCELLNVDRPNPPHL
jgi:hypothetical protein